MYDSVVIDVDASVKKCDRVLGAIEVKLFRGV